jgi:hypothetical protein
MPEACKYQIGDITIAVIPNTAEGEFANLGRFPDFTAAGPAEVSLGVFCGQVPDAPVEKPVFDTQLGWRLYQSQDRSIVWVRSADQDPYLVGVFANDYHSGEIYTTFSQSNPDQYLFPLSYPLGELYMASLLGTGYGVMQHACGVIYQGSGLLFTGVGGAGKTTTARLWESRKGARVLNDDHIIVRKNGSQFYIYGTPWHGQGGMALPEEAPLKRIFVLKQALTNQAIPLPPARAASDLLVRSFSTFWDKSGMSFTLKLLAELCQQVPCYELGFVPDSSAVDFVCNL